MPRRASAFPSRASVMARHTSAMWKLSDPRPSPRSPSSRLGSVRFSRGAAFARRGGARTNRAGSQLSRRVPRLSLGSPRSSPRESSSRRRACRPRHTSARPRQRTASARRRSYRTGRGLAGRGDARPTPAESPRPRIYPHAVQTIFQGGVVTTKKQRSAQRRFRRVREFLTTNQVDGTDVKLQGAG